MFAMRERVHGRFVERDCGREGLIHTIKVLQVWKNLPKLTLLGAISLTNAGLCG